MNRKGPKSRHDDAYTPRKVEGRDHFVGDDLSGVSLDELWECLSGLGDGGTMGSWWRDKSHQIGYRLLLRLTRAEDAVATAKAGRSTP